MKTFKQILHEIYDKNISLDQMIKSHLEKEKIEKERKNADFDKKFGDILKSVTPEEKEAAGVGDFRNRVTVKDFANRDLLVTKWLEAMLNNPEYYTTGRYTDDASGWDEKKTDMKRNVSYYLKTGRNRGNDRDKTISNMIIQLFADGNHFADRDLKEKLADYYRNDHPEQYPRKK